jgi:hypothetical protein
MIPKPVLIKGLKLGDIQQRVERPPEIPVVAAVVLPHHRIQLMMGHLKYGVCQLVRYAGV